MHIDHSIGCSTSKLGNIACSCVLAFLFSAVFKSSNNIFSNSAVMFNRQAEHS